MFVMDLVSIEHLFIDPICRVGLIHMWFMDSHQLKSSVNVYVILNNCKQNTTSLSLLAGRTVAIASYKQLVFKNCLLILSENCMSAILVRGINYLARSIILMQTVPFCILFYPFNAIVLILNIQNNFHFMQFIGFMLDLWKLICELLICLLQ